MGCDIHLYKEKLVGGKWVTADEWQPFDYGDEEGDKGMEVPWEKRFTERNYQLFGLLSRGVREEHEFSFEPRGLPFNASNEVRAAFESYGCDGHGGSYLYLFELKEMRAYLDQAIVIIDGMKDADELAALKATIAAGEPKWDLLFPYCRSTNSPKYVEFEIDVPASFYMGESLDKVIAGFDGVDGDNHRIVFFFDN